MTLTITSETATPPSHPVAALHADPLPGSIPRPSFESVKTYRPDVMNLENIGTDGAPNQNEGPVVTKAYSLSVRNLNLKFSVVCLALFLEGWNLGATGPLIPAIQNYYDVSSSLSWDLVCDFIRGR